MPISDNGGSTSEIIRVIGGPAIGDVRSRITRLIPDEQPHNRALRNLFSYRLPDVYDEAKSEWNQIVDGTHILWDGVESHYKEMIRPFFVHMHVELLKKSRPGREFRFERASVGNLFLSGARLFCGSLDSAVELLCKMTDVSKLVSVLPVLNTNFSYHISAELKNGDLITGQSQISHPSVLSLPTVSHRQDTNGTATPVTPTSFEDANLPFSHPALSTSQIMFSKSAIEQPLASAIKRIFYINPYGQEIHPRASPRVLDSVNNADAIVYSIGSLYTSIVPVVILEGFAEKLQKCKHKIMILNGLPDRETTYESNTSPRSLAYMDAEQYIEAVVTSCLYSLSGPPSTAAVSTTSATGIVTPLPQGHYHAKGQVDVISTCSGSTQMDNSHYNSHLNLRNIQPRKNHPNSDFVDSVQWTNFVTDFIHLTEPNGISVNVRAIEARGIRCHHVPHAPGSSFQYDLQSLEQTFLRIMG
ncbi:hypothetical protein AWJ20_3493 [Sugiyamaella lignohabitans]|uniref:Uncharacterized protein n=1 Tax=Sugiyamaella lignohabitans TaxID=796027 RepID=A0A167FY28_9ASCO|nr:uncharacterized protein AWJ20_3493 [Sugiyamaella lignohabitans]ANB15849.1 hypothetical protein AWJ20_3493 [Sugiyamaella lignohabitans]